MSVTLAPIGRLRTAARVSARTQSFFQNGTVSWIGELRDPVTNALVDRVGVTMIFRTPSGDFISVVAARSELGVYTAPVLLSVAGTWAVRLYVAGIRIAETEFVVVPGNFAALSASSGTFLFTTNILARLTEDGRARIMEA